MYKNKRILPFYVAIATTFIGLNASSEVELTGKVIHENAVFTQSGSTIGDRGIQATLGTGFSQTPLTANMTSSGMYRGVVTNGASASSPVHNSGTNLKSESTVKLYFDGTTDLIGGNTPFHVELNMVNDQREGLDEGNSSYTQRDLLREAYIDTNLADWAVRAGKQQVVWGTADGMKLLDTINPTDYADMAQNQMEDSRIPVWMLNAEKIQDDGSSVQVILSQPKENVFAGLNRSISTTERYNSNWSLDDTTLNNGTDTGNAFMLMGPDSITGVYNGFLNITPDLGSVATRFASAFKPSNNASGWDQLDIVSTSTGLYQLDQVTINGNDPSADMDTALVNFSNAFAGAASYLGGQSAAANGMNTFTVGGFKAMTMGSMSDALNPSGSGGNTHDEDLTYIPPGFRKAILDTWQGLTAPVANGGYGSAAAAASALGMPTANATYLTGDHMLALGFQPLYNTNLSNLTAAQDDAFDYMDSTTFKTFDAFANASSKYVYKMPEDDEFDLAARYNNTTSDGLNYSVVASFNYDKNPIINLSWRGANGQLLTTRQTYHDATGNGITKDAYDALVFDADNPYTRKTTTLQLYDAANATAAALAASSGVNTINATSVNGFYGGQAQQNYYDGTCAVSGCDDALGAEMGAAYAAATAARAQLQFLQEVKRVTQLGGAFDYAIDTAELGPVVIRGEALYTKDGYSPVMNKDRLAIGDLVGALQMQKADRLKFVLGADITVLTNMMVSAQFIQDTNLDHKDNGNEYTTDYATMHLSNGFNKAQKDKNFYTLFLSKPFGESGQHRFNNILMLEDTGGRWNRFDVEYTIDDNTVGSLEVNEYWGETNSQFGQLKNSSNVQLGLKYSF